MTIKIADRMDAQVLAGAAIFAEAFSAMGRPASQALRDIAKSQPTFGTASIAALALLARSRPLDNEDPEQNLLEQDHSFEDRARTFTENMHRLRRLSEQLLRYSATPVAAPAPDAPQPTPRVVEVSPDGTPIVAEPDEPTPGKKEYTLKLTHSEIHLLFWAMRVAEAAAAKDAFALFQDQDVYERVRDEEVGRDALDRFIDKFDAMHLEARHDDGEID